MADGTGDGHVRIGSAVGAPFARPDTKRPVPAARAYACAAAHAHDLEVP